MSNTCPKDRLQDGQELGELFRLVDLGCSRRIRNYIMYVRGLPPTP